MPKSGIDLYHRSLTYGSIVKVNDNSIQMSTFNAAPTLYGSKLEAENSGKKLESRENDIKSKLPNNLHIKVFCLVLMIGCCMLTITGFGFIGLIHGIFGVVFGVEGYYGASRYESKSILRVVFFLICSTVICLLIGIVVLNEQDQYCKNTTGSSLDLCIQTANFMASIYLAGGGGGSFVLAVIMYFFHRELKVLDALRKEYEREFLLG